MSCLMSRRRILPGVVALSTLALAGCGSSGSSHDSSSSTHTGAKATARFTGRTSCSSVMYVGESTSIGMVTPKQIPQAAERLEARLHAVGVKKLGVNVSGGRSSVERLLGRPNTLDVLTPNSTRSFHGCYLLALGVNDAANSSLPGSAGTAQDRIERVLDRIGDRPVLWPLVSTRPSLSGPYAESSMKRFDDALRAATKRHPNLRLYDWPTEMDPAWREPDGIHDDRIGSRERALMYSRALAVAFPAGLPRNASTTVGSVWGTEASPKNRPTMPAETGDHESFWAGDTQALKLYQSGMSTS